MSDTPASSIPRITSIDALRGFVMFMMIFVNDLAGAPKQIVPDWLVHFSDRHPKGSGMTFVDLVFPAFIFILGLSIPLALGSRLSQGEPIWKTVSHIVARTMSLLAVGILMVHETPSSDALGWSGPLWCTLMYLAAILAFCTVSPRRSTAITAKLDWNGWRIFSLCLRVVGLAALLCLALVFRGAKDQRILTLAPLHVDTSWYGILGLIGWAYLVASTVHLVFRGRRTAILGCMALLLCLFAAGRNHLFDHFWLNDLVGIGGTLGSQSAIAIGGLLIGSMLVAADMTDLKARAGFTGWFIAGCAAAALLLSPVYGISKNSATPSWCLWACAVTATFWFLFHLICDVHPVKFVSRTLAPAGQNVLLAYLLSEMLPGLLDLLHLGNGYESLSQASLICALARSAGCAALILFATCGLNRIGFRLKL